jgi:hypothetical protein
MMETTRLATRIRTTTMTKDIMTIKTTMMVTSIRGYKTAGSSFPDDGGRKV